MAVGREEEAREPPRKRNKGLFTELLRRETELDAGKSVRTNAVSLVGPRLELQRTLQGHRGCVNTVAFNEEGTRVISGSDDTRVVVWDWARGKEAFSYDTDHQLNIFQARSIPGLHDSVIVSAAADGMIRVAHMDEAGTPHRRQIGHHRGKAHKMVVVPETPQVIFTSGEDGAIKRADLRANSHEHVLSVRSASDIDPVGLHSISMDPLNSHLIAAAGHDNAVRVYDVRMASGSEDDFVMPVTKFVPHEVDQGGHITCVAWSKGGELAATYNMDNIYLFDASNCRAEREDRVLQKYEGHRNMDTVKGVAFYGHKDEYVVSGSDDGHIFLWDKHSAEICCLVKGDSCIVNCLDVHPESGALVSSGIDSDVKVWEPTAEEPGGKVDSAQELIRANREAGPHPRSRAFVRILGGNISDPESLLQQLHIIRQASGEGPSLRNVVFQLVSESSQEDDEGEDEDDDEDDDGDEDEDEDEDENDDNDDDDDDDDEDDEDDGHDKDGEEGMEGGE